MIESVIASLSMKNARMIEKSGIRLRYMATLLASIFSKALYHATYPKTEHNMARYKMHVHDFKDILAGKCKNGMKARVPIMNAYVVIVIASYSSSNFLPTIE